jgi:hypothetical protein
MSEPIFIGVDVAPALREIAWLALAEGDPDLAWAFVFLSGRDDLPVGAHFEDAEVGVLPTAANIRAGLRELEQRRLIEIRVERPGRPYETWSVFVADQGQDQGHDAPDGSSGSAQTAW